MTSSSASADDYARACLRVACAQLAEAAGFASARRTALDVLSDAAARYAASLGRAAKAYAEAAGRGEGNISDVLMALEDAGVTTEDLRNFIATEEELPFPHAVPNFPLKREPGVGLVDAAASTFSAASASAAAAAAAAPPIASAAPSFAALGERPPPHVPAHFPAFPDRHTFQATPLFDGAGAGASERAGGGRAGAAAAAAAVAAAVPTAGNLLAVAGRAGEDALVALSRRAGAPAAGSVGVAGAVEAATRGARTAGAAANPPSSSSPPLLLPLAPTPALAADDDGGLDAGTAAAAAAGAPPPAAPQAAAPLPAPPRPRDRRAAAVADAATARAETILAAGSDAMGLEDRGD